MVVPDANEVRGSVKSSEPQLSPVMHPAMHNLLTGLSKLSGLEVEVIYGRQCTAPEEDRWDGCVHYRPIPYRPLPLPGIGGPYLGRLFALLKHIRASKPDVVHAQGTEREAGMVAALSGQPSVLTLHGNFRALAEMTSPRPWSYTWINAKLESWILPRVAGVVCISRYTQDLVTPLNTKTWLVPNPTNQALLEVKHQPQNGRIVFLGVLDERKNPSSLLDACDLLVSQGMSLELHLWGNAPTNSDYGARILSACETRPWATYQGSASPHQIPYILKEAAILVLPSLEDNCPMVVIEALSCGVPVVASRVGGIPDLVDDQQNGILYPSGDQQALAHAIRTLLADPKRYEVFSQNARTSAIEKFSPASVASRHQEIYHEIRKFKSKS